MKWHGYTQHPDAHPERPWWRRDPYPPQHPGHASIDPIEFYKVTYWVRSDGKRACEPCPRNLVSMAELDKASPLPAPKPKAGQVWVWHDSSHVLSSVTRSYVFIGDDKLTRNCWPLPGAVLVAGEDAPWAPTGKATP